MTDERNEREELQAEGEQTEKPEGAQGTTGRPDALGIARGAASGAAETLRSGVSAMRDVRAASKRHSYARGRLRALRDELAADEAQLARRDEIEAGYAEIVAEQRRVIEETAATIEREQAAVERLEAEAADLEQRLAQLRKDNEEELRPYKRIVETARGRSDEAGLAVAEAKRAVRGAEGKVKDATENREQSISSANRAVDASQARLLKVQEELRRANEGTDKKAQRQLQEEVATELARVDQARSEVSLVTTKAQESVDAASTHLWTQKQSLEEAQREADAAKREYEERKGEHDRLLARHQEAEKDLEDAIAARREEAEEAKAAHDEAAERHDEALVLLEEAEEVHATPHETERLRESVALQQAAVEEQQAVVDGLAADVRGLRSSTRGARLALLAAALAVVALVVLVVVLVATR